MNRRRIVVTANVVLGVLAGVVLPSQGALAHQGQRLSAPTAVTAVAGVRSASVSWTPPLGPPSATGYVVVAVDTRSRVVNETQTGPAPMVTISRLRAGGTVRFKVAAIFGRHGIGPFSSLSAPVTILSTPPPTCSGSLAASVPSAAAGTPIPVYRSADFDIHATLTSSCTGDWTYSWSYRRGANASATVPSGWAGATGATLTVPKWTLDKYAVTGEDYTFTVTATPPAGSGATPATTALTVRVLSTAPVAGFVPTAQLLPAGPVYFYANVGSLTLDPDYPAGDEHLTFHWTATDLNVAEDTTTVADGDAASPVVAFALVALRSYEIQLKVCRADDAAAACATVKITADVASQGA
jgi:hypothetical protein